MPDRIQPGSVVRFGKKAGISRGFPQNLGQAFAHGQRRHWGGAAEAAATGRTIVTIVGIYPTRAA